MSMKSTQFLGTGFRPLLQQQIGFLRARFPSDTTVFLILRTEILLKDKYKYSTLEQVRVGILTSSQTKGVE